MLFFFWWGEKAEVTVAVLPFLITGEVWVVQLMYEDWLKMRCTRLVGDKS